MKKNVIHLNESQLRNLIKESVKRVLRENSMDELDWKTYANAQKKALQNKDRRYPKFKEAMIDAFNRRHARTDGGYSENDPQRFRKGQAYFMKDTLDSPYSRFPTPHPIYDLEDGITKKKADGTYVTTPTDRAGHLRRKRDNSTYLSPKEEGRIRDGFIADLTEWGDYDFDEYNNGNSKYVNGRWRHYNPNGEEDFTWRRS